MTVKRREGGISKGKAGGVGVAATGAATVATGVVEVVSGDTASGVQKIVLGLFGLFGGLGLFGIRDKQERS